MKTSQLAALWAAIVAILCAAQPAFANNGNGNGNNNNDEEPLIPVGSLSAYPTLVQTGTHPTLTWDIQYPESATDIVTIDPDGTVTPKVDLCMELRVLGASFQLGYDRRGRPVWGYVQAEVKADGASSFTQFFYNTQNKVKPSQVYHSQSVRAGRRIEVRSRCYNRGWFPWRSTEYSTPNVIALVNGDTPPSYSPAFQQGNIEDFLDPYLDAGGKIQIGPKDVIFLFELYSTNTGSIYFDMQDMVVLATFDYCKNNNGHGNNVDGVDSSNPGQGGGGPNGQDDPSGGIDDEIR